MSDPKALALLAEGLGTIQGWEELRANALSFFRCIVCCHNEGLLMCNKLQTQLDIQFAHDLPNSPYGLHPHISLHDALVQPTSNWSIDDRGLREGTMATTSASNAADTSSASNYGK
jgi:hypothetical protein